MYEYISKRDRVREREKDFAINVHTCTCFVHIQHLWSPNSVIVFIFSALFLSVSPCLSVPLSCINTFLCMYMSRIYVTQQLSVSVLFAPLVKRLIVVAATIAAAADTVAAVCCRRYR